MIESNHTSPRNASLGKIAEVFRDKGYVAASMGDISKATGLAKASLYHHFPGGKVEMLREVIALVDLRFSEYVLFPLRSEGTPAKRLQRANKGMLEYFDRGELNCIVGSLVLGGGLNHAQEALKAFVGKWQSALASVAEDAGSSKPSAKKRAEKAMSIIQGALVLARCSDQASYFERAVASLEEILISEEVVK